MWVENWGNDRNFAIREITKQYQLKVELDGQPVTLFREMAVGGRVAAQSETVEDELEALDDRFGHVTNKPKHSYYFSYDPTEARRIRVRYVAKLKEYSQKYAEMEKKMSELQLSSGSARP